MLLGPQGKAALAADALAPRLVDLFSGLVAGLVRRGGRGASVSIAKPRYREQGMALIFALGKFEWANQMNYEFGNHTR